MKFQCIFAVVLASIVALQCIASGRSDRFDRVVSVGDFHGDLEQAFYLLRKIGVISYQPDYYRQILLTKSRKRIIAGNDESDVNAGTAGGSSWEDEGTAPPAQFNDEDSSGFDNRDISANMIFNKRADLEGRETPDTYHWVDSRGSDGKRLRTLLVILGDSMNIGPDDFGLLQFWRRLTKEAVLASESSGGKGGGKVVFLLGNHEVNNLRSNFVGAHQWSLELSGGVNGRRRLLSTGTRIGRFVRSRPVIYYYDGLLFMHGGLFPKAVDLVEETLNTHRMSAKHFVEVVNNHTREALFEQGDAKLYKRLEKLTVEERHAEQKKLKIFADPIARMALNVNYETNGDTGVLLVHPLDECKKVRSANKRLGIEAQLVGHTPHDLPDYRYCDGALYAVDFKISQWKGGAYTPFGAVELIRAPKGSNTTWEAKLLAPKAREVKEAEREAKKQSLMYRAVHPFQSVAEVVVFVVCVMLGVFFCEWVLQCAKAGKPVGPQTLLPTHPGSPMEVIDYGSINA